MSFGTDIIPENQFGKDHFSLLLYLETRAVDHSGNLIAEGEGRFSSIYRLREYNYGGTNYPTRLKGGVNADDEHDDYSCLNDFIVAGWITQDDDDEDVIHLTEKGWNMAHQLRRWKADGKRIIDFEIPVT